MHFIDSFSSFILGPSHSPALSSESDVSRFGLLRLQKVLAFVRLNFDSSLVNVWLCFSPTGDLDLLQCLEFEQGSAAVSLVADCDLGFGFSVESMVMVSDNMEVSRLMEGFAAMIKCC